MMATNLALDDDLIREAQELGCHKTKKAAVTAALEEYVRRRKQLRIFELEGQVDYDPDYDYKALRRDGNRRIPAQAHWTAAKDQIASNAPEASPLIPAFWPGFTVGTER